MERHEEPCSRIRHDERGRITELVFTDVSSLSIERMNEDRWWLVVQRGGQEVRLAMRRGGRRVDVTVIDDHLGCVDDTPRE